MNKFLKLYFFNGRLAFPLYLLSNILFQMVIQYGALFLMLTGSSLLAGNILYSSIRNPIPLKIPFNVYMGKETTYLEPHYSWCFYLNLFNGESILNKNLLKQSFHS